MYTTSSVFLQALSSAGITHAFVNWGSDHPGLLEDLERQRTENHNTTNPAIITCPNEMVALSAAQGYAQVTGNPAAVIVHVDVGTQVCFFSHVDGLLVSIDCYLYRRRWREPFTMSIAVERQSLSMRVPLLSVAKANTKAHEMNGLCGYRVCILR
jgi:hypothetical protein